MRSPGPTCQASARSEMSTIPPVRTTTHHPYPLPLWEPHFHSKYSRNPLQGNDLRVSTVN